MRELEFLPSWYGQTRSRKRVLTLQIWVAAFMAVGMSGWLLFSQHKVLGAEDTLSGLNTQLKQSRSLLDELDKQLEMKQTLVNRERINGKLGESVEMSRLLSQLEKIMPKEMSLLELDVSTDEQVTNTVTSVAAVKATKNGEQLIDRKLKVRITAVAPTDLDVVNFLTELSHVTCFKDIAPTYFRDRAEAEHVMREFVVSFWIDLNDQAVPN